MKTQTIIQDILVFLKSPKQALTSILEADVFNLDKKKLSFIAFMHLYSLLLPSCFVFLTILVLPAMLVMIGFIYFLSQELMMVYSESSQKELKDIFLYRIAYCLSLIGVPALLLSVLINLFFLVKTDNLLFSGAMSLFFSFLPMLVSAWFMMVFVKLISAGRFGLLKLIELMFASLLTTLKAKFGWEAITEIREDLTAIKKN